MASKQQTVASFVETAPPGELSNVVADIKALAPSEAQALAPAYKKYNEEQYITVKLPDGNGTAILSPYNSLDNNRYFDTATETSFEVDHASQKTSNPQPHALETPHADLLRNLHKALTTTSSEHFPTSSHTITPTNTDPSTLTILLVATKFSPQNFWNARWRSTYTYNPSTTTLAGSVKVDVHYYEDGNVRMNTRKEFASREVSGGAEAVGREIAKLENKFQEDLNRGFGVLGEGCFKSLRRQLPVTRQRMEWEKFQGYRLGQDIGGGRAK
ncbi:hypothetical protein B0A50_04978 [Salinomyces thailandicus]|uniref:F-actin-capping protein subunit alpha n=1 Tax=Salinomyces thailandicus TaxID=706561 RepID=A0A4U0TZ99_9PEZI|nr:hypothetical protein B0A50_04978 [Salinomyces thailandica]